jgi:pantoate--beta-alanine ligase
LNARRADWRRAGERIALVATMGSIHDGHLALVKKARALADRTIVSLYVNPRQFVPGEDLARYPRDEAGDRARLAGVDLLFAPSDAEIFGEGFATTVTVGGVTEGLCGPERPGHFEGVATVVAKLLLMALPDFALFGEKDYQQLLMVRRLVADLAIPVDIVSVPTAREADGLACSSRNAFLSEADRAIAVRLNQVLGEIVRRLEAREASVAEALAWGRAELEGAGFSRLDYLSLCDAETLAPLDALEGPARILAAVRLGDLRLIDNMPVAPATA